MGLTKLDPHTGTSHANLARLPAGAPDMPWLQLLSYLFGGAVLANAIPHFVSGMMGQPFQTPRQAAREGLSSSTVNVLWGCLNLVIGYLLICRVGDFDCRNTPDAMALGLGVFAVALFSARHFGRFHGGRFHGGNKPERR